jgi:hypothetical protein
VLFAIDLVNGNAYKITNYDSISQQVSLYSFSSRMRRECLNHSSIDTLVIQRIQLVFDRRTSMLVRS